MKKKSPIIFFFIEIIFLFSLFQNANQSDIPIYDKIIPDSGAVLINELLKKNEKDGIFNVILEVQKPENFNFLKNRIKSKDFYQIENFCTTFISLSEIIQLSHSKYIKTINILDYSSKYPFQSNSLGTSDPFIINAIIDQGFDCYSNAFYFEDGSSRILYYWDQTAILKETPNKSDFTKYGIEYNRIRLEQIKNSSGRVLNEPPGHGMLSALIASGKVDIINDNNQSILPGFNPNSWLILVNTTGKKCDILNAILYVKEKSKFKDAKLIINLSFGKHFGPHQSEDSFIRTIDALLDDNTILIVSAGNDNGRGISYERNFENAMEFDIPFRIDTTPPIENNKKNKLNVTLELWYKSTLNLDVELISPNNDNFGPVKRGEYKIFNLKKIQLIISNTFSASIGEYKCIRVTLNDNNSQTLLQGNWKFHIKSRSKNKKFKIQGWITESQFYSTYFEEKKYWANTISALAYSTKSLSVGSFIQERSGHIMNPPYSNFYHSDKGEIKPDVFVLGQMKVWEPEIGLFINHKGTSASASLLTRFISYLWTKFPQLKAHTIKSILKNKVMIFSEEKTLPCWLGSKIFQPFGISELIEIFKKTLQIRN